MILFVLAYIGGVLTILSPCILPVLPFVFARGGRPFWRSTFPMLIGMALTFAAVATLAAIGGGWAVAANRYGRYAALALLGLFGLFLLMPSLSERITRPLVGFGNRLTQSAQAGLDKGSSIAPSFLLGIATGLLWAPCAGPILGLLLTGAALKGATIGTTILLLAYAAGAATSLGLALTLGGKVFKTMKKNLGLGEGLKRLLGVAVLAGVIVIGLGLDTGILTQLSTANTSKWEQRLLDRIDPQQVNLQTGEVNANDLKVEGVLPPLSGAVLWLNSPPLTPEALRGHVVLVDFWTYSCINCLRSLPYVKAWAEKYKDQGLIVIGVHAPEFAFERDPDNVRKAVKDLGITYPVALDNNYKIWSAFHNRYWPAHYFADAQGNIRYHHFGEGEYDKSDEVIRALLAEAGKPVQATPLVVAASGDEMAPDNADTKSPETYLGYQKAQRFASPESVTKDKLQTYSLPPALDLNQWALAGQWRIGAEKAELKTANGRIAYRFHARDLHMVLGPAKDGKPIRFRVTIDGAAPGENHGVDTDADGLGMITDQRLYQLVRQGHDIQEHTFEIEFLDPGVQAFAFTFG